MSPGVRAIMEKSIAVLPFENLSEEKANALFAEGVQDQILTNLAQIADLKVISRMSVMQYKSGAPRNLREIGQQLGVTHDVDRKHLAAEEIFERIHDENDGGDFQNPERKHRQAVSDEELNERGHHGRDRC